MKRTRCDEVKRGQSEEDRNDASETVGRGEEEGMKKMEDREKE